VSSKDKIISEFTNLGYGLTQAGSATTSSLSSELLIVPSQMAYVYIPASELRNFVDGLFPDFAVNRIADSAAGFGHRYRAGHDLLIDIPSTISSHGWREGFNHMGHVILTDFPTKAGIPIPGFSQAGLGQFIEQAGISSGWVQMSLFDSGVGIFAFSEGASTLIQAFQGALSMNFDTAIQTFGVGGIEMALGIASQNPLLAIGGAEHLVAGLVSTYQTISVYVDPLDLFGAAGVSALLGFGVTYGLLGENLKDATLYSLRSGAIGSLYTISTAFGFGALAGFTTYRLSSELAKHHDNLNNACFSVDQHSYDLFIQELCSGNIRLKEMIEETSLGVILPSNSTSLDLRNNTIPTTGINLLPNNPTILNTSTPNLIAEHDTLNTRPKILPDDPWELFQMYKQVLQ